MKKIILTILLFSFLVMPAIGLATDPPVVPPGLAPAPHVTPLRAVNIIINLMFGVLMIAAVVLIIYGAISIVMAGGSEDGIKAGKTAIIGAIAAVIIAVLARGLVNWIAGLFGVTIPTQ